MSDISSRIKKALDIRNMTQTDLAQKTGIGKSSISTYIAGHYSPKQENIKKMACALSVNEGWLQGDDVPMEPEPSLANIIDSRINKLGLSLSDVAQKANVPVYWLENIDTFIPGQLGDNEIGYDWITKVADVLEMPGSVLRSALARQEIPAPDDQVQISADEAFRIYAQPELSENSFEHAIKANLDKMNTSAKKKVLDYTADLLENPKNLTKQK